MCDVSSLEIRVKTVMSYDYCEWWQRRPNWTNCSWLSDIAVSFLYLCHARLKAGRIMFSVCTFVPSFVVYLACSVTRHCESQWTHFDPNWHKWFMGKWHEIVNFGLGGQRSRMHEAEDRFGRLTEASLSTALGRVAFLVKFWTHFYLWNR